MDGHNNLNQNPSTRERIAAIIAYGVPIATIVLAIGAVIFAITLDENKDKIEFIKYAFASLLPLWGTWLGTILAYYFSKENFEAANKNVQKLIESITPKQKLESTPVTQVMIKYKDLKCEKLSKTDDPDMLKVMDLRNKIKDNKIKRWPIFKDQVYVYIIHKSIFDEFITENINDKKLNELTIADMKKIGGDWINRVLEKGAGFVPEDATLYDAKEEMDKEEVRNDVFVTENGKSDGKVLGWISNVDIAKHGKY